MHDERGQESCYCVKEESHLGKQPPLVHLLPSVMLQKPPLSDELCAAPVSAKLMSG